MGETGSEYYDSSTWIVLVGIVIVFLFVLLTFTMRKTSVETPAEQVFFQCLPGQCATVIATGEKSCPLKKGDIVLYDPSFETCNSEFTCESRVTPFALQPDGSTDVLGVCVEGEICRCLQQPRCPIRTMATFQTLNGSIFLHDSSSSRAIFTQNPISAQGNTQDPIQFDAKNASTEFCAVRPYHLDRVSPGACLFASVSNPTLDEIIDCMGRNPCVVGVMSFLPRDSNNFVLSIDNTQAIQDIPVGCVPGIIPEGGGSPCSSSEVAVWDTHQDLLFCHDTGRN